MSKKQRFESSRMEMYFKVYLVIMLTGLAITSMHLSRSQGWYLVLATVAYFVGNFLLLKE